MIRTGGHRDLTMGGQLKVIHGPVTSMSVKISRISGCFSRRAMASFGPQLRAHRSLRPTVHDHNHADEGLIFDNEYSGAHTGPLVCARGELRP